MFPLSKSILDRLNVAWVASFVLLVCVMISCDDSQKSSSAKATSENVKSMEQLLDEGRSATATAQALLLAEVGQQIAKGGPEQAVSYCNVRAIPLIDSLSVARGVSVSRISNRNRNPDNTIVTQEDKRAWTHWVAKQSGQGATDTVLYDRAGHPYYYKPIRIMAETCLKCHGSRSSEISLATLQTLDSLYPDDKAVNYRMGDLRGLWKVAWQAD